MRRMRVLVFMVAIVIAAASLSSAQQGPGGPAKASPGQGGNAPTAAQQEEVRKKVEAVKIWKLTEALKLDANTSAKLSAFINPLDQQRQHLWQDHMTTMRELRTILQSPKPDETKLRAALEKLEKNNRAMQEVKNKESSGLKNILTTEQQARYFVFQQEFRHEMRGMISGAKGGGPGKGGGMGPGKGQGMRRGQMQGGQEQQPAAQ